MRISRWAYQSDPTPGQRLWMAHPLCRNLVAAYFFNDFTTFLNYATGETCSMNGGFSLANRITSDTGYAYDFQSGSTNYLAQGAPYHQKSLVKDYTILVRARLDNDSVDRALYSQASATTTHRSVKSLIVRATTRRLSYLTSNAYGDEIAFDFTTTTVPLNTWFTVILNVISDNAGTQVIVWTDSASESGSTTSLTSTPDTTVECRIGASQRAGLSPWDGPMDHLFLWNETLVQNDLRDLRALPFLIGPPTMRPIMYDYFQSVRNSVQEWQRSLPPRFRPAFHAGISQVPDARFYDRELFIGEGRFSASAENLNYNVSVTDEGAYEGALEDLNYSAEVTRI